MGFQSNRIYFPNYWGFRIMQPQHLVNAPSGLYFRFPLKFACFPSEHTFRVEVVLV